jgi:hypothetical protein
MGFSNDLQVGCSLQERQAALDAVLASSTFSRNQRLSRLLTYLCSRSFAGEGAFLKEYTIATDVFGRPPEFDQSSDAIVRVEMHRLRKKLKEFYASEGADQNVEIVIHPGHYAPEFVERRPPDEWKEVVPVLPVALPATQQTIAVPHRERARPRWLWLALAAAAVILAAAIWTVGRNRTVAPLPPSARELALPALNQSEAVRILSGRARAQRDREGNVWGPDTFFNGGTPLNVAGQPIYRTRNPFLYLGARTGDFSYKIPLKPGVYELHLHFADLSFTPGVSMEGGENMRTFHVALNGAPLLREFDIIANAGTNTACERVFKDVTPDKDGYLHLTFTKVVNEPLLNAIEILPAVPHRIRTVRIATQDVGFTDKSGTAWRPDNYFLNGRSIAKMGIVSGPIDPQVYERERYGNFSYAIPVAPGNYELRLHFAETYFGPKEQGGGGVGDRIFDVFCNGTALLSQFDVFKEAGSGNELIETFHGLQPNGQGTLLISFMPRKNYAMVSALELIDETPQ